MIRESEINSLAISLKYPILDLPDGKAQFLTDIKETLGNDNEQEVQTVLAESSVPIYIQGVYDYQLFPSFVMDKQTIIISDEDYRLINEPLMGYGVNESNITYYAFHVPEWLRTKRCGNRFSKYYDKSLATYQS